MRILFFIGVIVSISTFSQSQENLGGSNTWDDQPDSLIDSDKKAPRIGSEHKNTVSFTLGFFDPWIGVSYEHMSFNRWGLDIAAGLVGGSVGTKFYFPKLSDGKFSMLVGFSEGILLMVGAKHYIPVGFTYMGKEGGRISLDVGPQIEHGSNDAYFGVSLRLGKSF